MCAVCVCWHANNLQAKQAVEWLSRAKRHCSVSVLAFLGTNGYVLADKRVLVRVNWNVPLDGPRLAVGGQGLSDHSCVGHQRYALILPDTSQKCAAMHWGPQLFMAVVSLADSPIHSVLLKNLTAALCVFTCMAASSCGLRLARIADVLVPTILTCFSHNKLQPAPEHFQR